MARKKDGSPQSPRGVIYACPECHRQFGNRHTDIIRHCRDVHNILNPKVLIIVSLEEKGKQCRPL